MQAEFIVNGGVSLVLSAENEMEEQLLKQLMKQDNELTEMRTSVTILNKNFKNAVIIGKRLKSSSAGKAATEDNDPKEETM